MQQMMYVYRYGLRNRAIVSSVIIIRFCIVIFFIISFYATISSQRIQYVCNNTPCNGNLDYLDLRYSTAVLASALVSSRLLQHRDL